MPERVDYSSEEDFQYACDMEAYHEQQAKQQEEINNYSPFTIYQSKVNSNWFVRHNAILLAGFKNYDDAVLFIKAKDKAC